MKTDDKVATLEIELRWAVWCTQPRFLHQPACAAAGKGPSF